MGIHLLEDVVALKRTKMLYGTLMQPSIPLPSDVTCQLDVLGHDGDLFGMDGAKVGVLKETH